MRKVKKGRVVASVRRTPGKAPAAKKSSRSTAARRKTAGGQAPARSKAKVAPAPRISVRELDPKVKCGAGTSVEWLLRVEERLDRERRAHLVFFDRHGWYCEHGATCPAVAHARKHVKHTTRSRHVRNGTDNGRMRA